MILYRRRVHCPIPHVMIVAADSRLIEAPAHIVDAILNRTLIRIRGSKRKRFCPVSFGPRVIPSIEMGLRHQ